MQDIKLKPKEKVEENTATEKRRTMHKSSYFIHTLLLAFVLIVLFLVFGKGDSGKNLYIEEVVKSDNGEVVVLGEDFRLYTNDKYRFSVNTMSGLTEQVFQDEFGETIVFQKDKGFGFQIFITQFEGKEEIITSSMVRKDIPGAVIENPQEAILGDGTRALIFFTDSNEIGKTREVWFIKNGNLFQFTTFASQDTLLAGILSTIKFY